jgi:hypothetical protein
MIWIVLGIAIIIALSLLILKTKTQVELKISEYPYSKKEVLFSPAERSFLGVLTQAVGDKAQIFGKVRVADIIAPKKGMSKAEWQKAFNKISGKHFDFILCNKDDLSIICAIELDDASHQSKKRQKRDSFLEGVCKSSSVPLVQVQAKSSYNISEIKELFSSYISSDLIDENIKEVSPNLDAVEEKPSSVEREEKVCPKCSSPLVKRMAKKGGNAGKDFLACSSFPKCRYTEAINA